MKQLTIISGKGGTGKTTVVAALARIAQNKILVDADVDASNLQIVTDAKLANSEKYIEGFGASIDIEKCIKCDLCRQHCRFDAVKITPAGDYIIDEHACEGCKVCQYICPADAVTLAESDCGFLKKSSTPFGTLWHGELAAGRDNSGKMVSCLREYAAQEAQEKDIDWVIIDGAPGIGCAVIASLTGVDTVVIVAEPTLSAIHDLKRVAQLAEYFHLPIAVIINKSDINESLTREIERWADANELPVLSKIPVDKRIIEAMSQRKSPIEIEDEKLTELYKSAWENVLEMFE